MFKVFMATSIALAAFAAPAFAQDAAANPDGVWKDKWGTTFTFSTCGEGKLCGVLEDIQGSSRNEQSLALVGKQVMSADQTSANKWEGQIAMGGDSAKAIVEQVDENTMTITGCRAEILCQTLTYERAS